MRSERAEGSRGAGGSATKSDLAEKASTEVRRAAVVCSTTSRKSACLKSSFSHPSERFELLEPPRRNPRFELQSLSRVRELRGLDLAKSGSGGALVTEMGGEL